MANTWDNRSMPDKCKDTSERHGIIPGWERVNYAFSYGSRIVRPYKMKEDESQDLLLMLNFGPDDARDWSIVVYGDKSTVSIKHKQDLESQKMPLLDVPSNRPKPPKVPVTEPPKPKTFPIEEETDAKKQLSASVAKFPASRLTTG